jgi:hypothetical protein
VSHALMTRKRNESRGRSDLARFSWRRKNPSNKEKLEPPVSAGTVNGVRLFERMGSAQDKAKQETSTKISEMRASRTRTP